MISIIRKEKNFYNYIHNDELHGYYFVLVTKDIIIKTSRYSSILLDSSIFEGELQLNECDELYPIDIRTNDRKCTLIFKSKANNQICKMEDIYCKNIKFEKL